LNLPELIERIQGIIRPAIQFKKLQTNLTIEENTPTYVYLNESSVVQIMLNLIYNAIKFTDIGSINVKIGWKPFGSETSKASRLPISTINRNSLAIKRKDSAKAISAELNRIDSSRNLSGKGLMKGKLSIEVCDTGCGMPEDALKKLFQPFSQVTTDSAKQKQGTGLGLWLTKLLVEKIRGQTKVTSRVGKGSTFTVLIECQAVPESAMLSPRRNLYIEPVNKTVNVVEPPRKRGVLIGGSPMENFCIKNYMQNLNIDVIEEVRSLKDLLNYLRSNMSQELVIVCDGNQLDTLINLNRLNSKLLEKKLVITVEDEKQNCKTHCDIEGSQCLERPVRWNDFLKAVSRAVTPLDTKLGHSF
jgi:two-component sensor histidine kinase